MAEDKICKSLEADELMERIKNKETVVLIDTLTGIFCWRAR